MEENYKSESVIKLEEIMEEQADFLEHRVYEMIKNVYESANLSAETKFEEIKFGIKRALPPLIALGVRPRFYAALYGVLAPYYNEGQKELIWDFFNRIASSENSFGVNIDEVLVGLSDKKLENNLIGSEEAVQIDMHEMRTSAQTSEDGNERTLENRIAVVNIYLEIVKPKYIDKNGRLYRSTYLLLNNASKPLRSTLLKKLDSKKGYYADDKDVQKVIDYLCEKRPDLIREPDELSNIKFSGKSVFKKPLGNMPKPETIRKVNYEPTRKSADIPNVRNVKSSEDLWGFKEIEKGILAEMPALMKQEIEIARDDIEEILGKSATGDVDDNLVKWSYRSSIEPNWRRILSLFSTR